MHEQARSEQEIVKALGEALKRADDQLLVAIRNIALEHEMRREGILRELQALATRLGAFPPGNHAAVRPVRIPSGVSLGANRRAPWQNNCSA
jgi:hypothetical protein